MITAKSVIRPNNTLSNGMGVYNQWSPMPASYNALSREGPEAFLSSRYVNENEIMSFGMGSANLGHLQRQPVDMNSHYMSQKVMLNSYYNDRHGDHCTQAQRFLTP